LFSSTGIDPHATETIVNAFAILNGLLLSVEFTLITGLDTSYWDDLNATLAACGQSVDYWSISILLYYSALVSLVAIFLCVIFVALQPRIGHHIDLTKADERQIWADWWKAGRFTFIAILGALLDIGPPV
jgi:hypothetical protein